MVIIVLIAMTILQHALAQRLTDAETARLPVLTRRDVRIPEVPGKAFAVIGVRRAGKTSFMWQRLADQLAAGRPRESLILLGLEDDRLAGMTAADLDWFLEEYFRRHPTTRGVSPLTLCLDEVQVVPGWERFARRVLDTERVELWLSGSSAKLLSREVATSLRGRGMELLVHPFSFREALRHEGMEPPASWESLSAAEHSALEHRLRRYLVAGGFPEAQRLAERDRTRLLSGYVDVVILRDVIERHTVSNPIALRWMQRQLLANAAGSFSVQKFFQSLKSQGIPVGKDTLYDYLAHLEDAFLVRTVPVATRSARRRAVNPRKAYPVDPGLIELFAAAEGETGHALETVVLLELERRGFEVAYVRTKEGWEVDFLAHEAGRPTLLLQVSADVSEAATLEREVRALSAAMEEHRDARPFLITLDPAPPRTTLPSGMTWMPASRWLLDSADVA